MKLIIYDKCWDAIINLPKTIQKKVPDFIKKFREDTKSASIHLEPISTFRDPNLRTARISQKYRAIIRVPDSGDMYHLLWIDNHDEAMAWAENKLFEWNANTQSYQVFTAPEVVAEQPVQPETEVEPEAAGRTFLSGFDDKQLLRIGVPEILIPAVRKLDSLQGLEKMESYLPVEAFENLFYLFDGMDIRDIIIDIEEGKVASTGIEAQTLSANNQRSFFELTDDETLNEILQGGLQKWKVFLHPSQRKLVEGNFNGATKVTGGAGTGKTVAALHRAKRLSEHDYGRNGKPILFTTYTKSLTRNLAKEFPGMKIDPRIVHLNNIDAFCVEKAKDLGLVAPDVRILDFQNAKKSEDLWEEALEFELSEYDSEFLDAEYKDVILFNNIKTDREYYKVPRTGRVRRISRKDKMEIWRLVQKFEQLKKEQNYVNSGEVCNLLYDHCRQQEDKPYGHVIADEIQDFSNVELRLLRVLVPEGPNDLFLVGDPLQKVYSRNINFSKAGINVRGRRSRRLKINYRTTEEIKRTAISTLRNITFDDFDGEEERKNGYVSLRHGMFPEYQVFREKGQELDHIVQRIRAYTDPDSQSPFDFSDICVAARTRNAVKDILSRLHQEKIPYYDITTDSGTGNKQDGVRLSTFHNMKGLEFKSVFLMDVNQRTLPFLPHGYEQWNPSVQKEHDQRELALIYVAMTRAVHTLDISGVGEKSGVLPF
ncbi:MAG: DEAD/DEAH box helicase [Lewinellaceae bacterium]|nr:DEAD/DEAH box helicase [Lewinellaceae bacterium]